MGAGTDCDVVMQSANKQARKQLPPSYRNIYTNIFITFYIIVAFLMNGLFVPIIRRGFFCSDSTIQYPIKTDTVSFPVLLVFALLLPTVVIKLCDKQLQKIMSDLYPRARRRKLFKSEDIKNQEPSFPMRAMKRRLVVNDDEDAQENQDLCKIHQESNGDREETTNEVRPTFVDKPKWCSDLQLFMWGFGTTSLFTGIGKVTCGRLRPHFMKRCLPDIDCQLPQNIHRYIENYSCTNSLRTRDIAYISTSWPSGHASIIFYSMLYLIFYLNTVITLMRKHRQSVKVAPVFSQPLLVFFTYSLLVGLAVYISMTRISDFHHHPTDVFSGSVLGVTIAVIQAKYLLKPLHKEARN